jgi:hypothetical protein
MRGRVGETDYSSNPAFELHDDKRPRRSTLWCPIEDWKGDYESHSHRCGTLLVLLAEARETQSRREREPDSSFLELLLERCSACHFRFEPGAAFEGRFLLA